MNMPNNKLNVFLALFITKNKVTGVRPNIAEVDKWRLGKIKGARAEEIKHYLANDAEVYQWWNQLRQEAKTSKVKKASFNLLELVQTFYQPLLQPRAIAPAFLTVFMAYFLVSILQTSSNDILKLAQEDIETWQQITKADNSYQLGMTRQWKTEPISKIESNDNIKNYQIGLNQFLKKPIVVSYSSIKLCETKDVSCQENKTIFTTMGQWVSKANVICQQNNKAEKTKIENRLNDWQSNKLMLSENALKTVFEHWNTAEKEIDPCLKIQQLITLGAQP